MDNYNNNQFQGQYAQALQSLFNQLQQESKGGSVDLTQASEVPARKMRQAGYDMGGDDYATTYTGTYSNPQGTVAGNFTPISNGYPMSDSELTRYAEGVVGGSIPNDYMGSQVGRMYYGQNAIQDAESAARRQHELQQSYYALLDRYLGR